MALTPAYSDSSRSLSGGVEILECDHHPSVCNYGSVNVEGDCCTSDLISSLCDPPYVGAWTQKECTTGGRMYKCFPEHFELKAFNCSVYLEYPWWLEETHDDGSFGPLFAIRFIIFAVVIVLIPIVGYSMMLYKKRQRQARMRTSGPINVTRSNVPATQMPIVQGVCLNSMQISAQPPIVVAGEPVCGSNESVTRSAANIPTANVVSVEST